jgi:hypothetical protein
MGAAVERLTAHLPKGTNDETWLSFVGKNGWVVLTRDKRIRYRRLERLALQAANVPAFVFTGGNVTIKETGAMAPSFITSEQRESQGAWIKSST